MPKRKKRERSWRPAARPSPEYRRGVLQADKALASESVEIRPDNWQQLALEWFAPYEPEHGALARYIAQHQSKLGVPWSRELLRMEVFFQAKDYLQIIDHYDHAFSRYPRCALVEMWVADQVFRHAGDFWRARAMYRYAADQLPDHPKPYYELGFMSYLLGDFPSALDWLDQAAERAGEADPEMDVRVFFNRAVIRFLLDGDRQAAIADVEEALRRKPDYPQAQETLRGLRGTLRWVPW